MHTKFNAASTLIAFGAFTLFVSLGVLTPATPANALPGTSIVLEFTTSVPNEDIEVGFGGKLDGVQINWGDINTDGTTVIIDVTDQGLGEADHLYRATPEFPGTYQVEVSGVTLEHFGYCGAPANFWTLTKIISWGSLNTTSLECAAWSRSGLTSVPETLPSTVTNLNNMFFYAYAFDQDLSGWNTTNVTSMERTFDTAILFNHSLASWDVSNVTNMLAMLTNTLALSDANYSSTLVGWAEQNVQPGLDLDEISAKAIGCPAIAARDALLEAPNSWTILDENPTQVCAAQTVTWSPTNTSTTDARSIAPNARAIGSDFGAITYSVSNAGTTGCTVNATTGVITALASGTCLVRATAAATPDCFAGTTEVSFMIGSSASALARTGASIRSGVILGIALFSSGLIATAFVLVYRRRPTKRPNKNFSEQ